MGLRINSNTQVIESNLARAQKNAENSMEKLSSGIRFTKSESLPAERAQSDKLTSLTKQMQVYKRNASDGLSLAEFADSNLNEISHANIRLKELVSQASNPSLTNEERQYLFLEYQELYEEIDRVAQSSYYNGRSLLTQDISASSDSVGFQIGPPSLDSSEDVSLVTITGLDEISAHPEDLGLISAESLLSGDGVSSSDLLSHFNASHPYELGETFDAAHLKIADFRARFGAAASRLTKAVDNINVTLENMDAANSRIKDVDYATEISQLTKANILVQAGSSLLSQKQQHGKNILDLLRSLER